MGRLINVQKLLLVPLLFICFISSNVRAEVNQYSVDYIYCRNFHHSEETIDGIEYFVFGVWVEDELGLSIGDHLYAEVFEGNEYSSGYHHADRNGVPTVPYYCDEEGKMYAVCTSDGIISKGYNKYEFRVPKKIFNHRFNNKYKIAFVTTLYGIIGEFEFEHFWGFKFRSLNHDFQDPNFLASHIDNFFYSLGDGFFQDDYCTVLIASFILFIAMLIVCIVGREEEYYGKIIGSIFWLLLCISLQLFIVGAILVFLSVGIISYGVDVILLSILLILRARNMSYAKKLGIKPCECREYRKRMRAERRAEKERKAAYKDSNSGNYGYGGSSSSGKEEGTEFEVDAKGLLEGIFGVVFGGGMILLGFCFLVGEFGGTENTSAGSYSSGYYYDDLYIHQNSVPSQGSNSYNVSFHNKQLPSTYKIYKKAGTANTFVIKEDGKVKATVKGGDKTVKIDNVIYTLPELK